MSTTVTDEQVRELAGTAKPFSLALLSWGPERHQDGDPCVRAGMMRCEVHPCHGFPGDALPAEEFS
jgi:hypothetical protein